MHADNRYMYIFKYRGCRFEMAAGPAASKCLQVRNGPAEAPEAPDTSTNTYSSTSRRTSTRTSTCIYANTTTSACTCAYKHIHVHPLTCLQTLREQQHRPRFLETHYEHLEILPCTCTLEPAAPEVHLYHLDGEVNAEAPAAPDVNLYTTWMLR